MSHFTCLLFGFPTHLTSSLSPSATLINCFAGQISRPVSRLVSALFHAVTQLSGRIDRFLRQLLTAFNSPAGTSFKTLTKLSGPVYRFLSQISEPVASLLRSLDQTVAHLSGGIDSSVRQFFGDRKSVV